MNLILKWIIFALLIMLIAWVIRPLVQLISLPLNVLTFGLFSLVINTLLFLLIAKFSPGFQIEGFWSGFFGALILSVATPLIDKIKVKKA